MKKAIPSINVPIMKVDGSMELAWYLYLRLLNAHRVIDFQEPTADNGYVWYTKYADGKVEQGGTLGLGDDTEKTIVFPVPMRDTNYTWNVGLDSDDDGNVSYKEISLFNRTKETAQILWSSTAKKSWSVTGIAANA